MFMPLAMVKIAKHERFSFDMALPPRPVGFRASCLSATLIFCSVSYETKFRIYRDLNADPQIL